MVVIWSFLSFIDRRRTILVHVAAVITLVSVFGSCTLPTFFYFLDLPLQEERAYHVDQSVSINCNSSQLVTLESLANSPCSTYFNWSQTSNRSATKYVSSKCEFRTSDRILGSLKGLADSVGTNALSRQCKEDITYLLCHYVYTDCDIPYYRPTAQECSEIQNKICGNDIWNEAIKFLPILDTEECIGIPDCYRDFDNASTTNSLNSEMPSNNVNEPQNESDTTCNPPLIQTELPDIDLKCSPTCLTADWTTDVEETALEFLLYLTAVIIWFCCITTFITWAKVAEL
jgi:hypothetical protein